MKAASVVLVILTVGLVLAACGSSSRSSGGHRTHAPDFLAFSKCMRANGVTNFPDPLPGGGIQLSAGLNPASPSFKSAQGQCRKILPGGGPSNHPTEADKLAMLKISECMRGHGITGFPDPSTGPPPNPGADVQAIDRDGVTLAVPNTIDSQSPAYKHAAEVCGFAP